jgi:hypothetical protein
LFAYFVFAGLLHYLRHEYFRHIDEGFEGFLVFDVNLADRIACDIGMIGDGADKIARADTMCFAMGSLKELI